ncbi:MAG: nickel pincer cofactor biosynthesis protein LarC [Actinobacteria bacterium]|nr:MAG: nickel pincer cofactor biosynthesis protein LarC [Actinomycetota bacterium]
MTTVAFFDCFSGIAGDMVLGALVDAGVPLEVIGGPLDKIQLDPFQLEAVRVERHGIAATSIRVRSAESGVVRTYASVRAIIQDAPLPPRAKQMALDIVLRLAEAEASVHGKDVAHVPFHELGAVDTIVDVVGAALGLDYLGVERIYASAVATGMGMIKTDHGVYPIPGPAVVELLKGVPIYSRGIPSELVTPTGAAILAATATSFGEMPAMRVERVGYGAGTRELDIPNVVRLLVGRAAQEDTAFGPVPAVVLEANIDDMNPEFYQYVIERLFAAGAQDAWTTPITMKHGRPAATLHVLVGPGDEERCRDVIFAETTTLGLRRSPVEKWTLPREITPVEVDGGTVRVKIARNAAGAVTGRPLKQVFSEAQAAAERLLDQRP